MYIYLVITVSTF